MTDSLNADEARELLDAESLDEGEQASEEFRKATTIDTGASKILAPVTVTTTHGEVFDTNGLHTCTYTQVGCYLAVHEKGQPHEEASHIVVPWQQVAHVELKFNQMVELAKEMDESSSD